MEGEERCKKKREERGRKGRRGAERRGEERRGEERREIPKMEASLLSKIISEMTFLPFCPILIKSE
jgi:hypothetical protein